MAGPLAPDRDAGLDRGSLGSISARELSVWSRPSHVKKDKSALSGNRGNIVAGDRVCVVRKGPHLGQIGEVVEVRKKEGTVTISGVNMADIKLPPSANTELRERKISTIELPFPIEDVRLVFKPEGLDRDIIVRYLERGYPIYDHGPASTIPEHTRYIGGTRIEIPWPAEAVPERTRHMCDTPRLHVNEDTYIPEVLNAPFPQSIAEELGSKYRRDRQRHADNYVANKIVEDARSEWYESRRLITPVRQHLEHLAQRRRELEAKELDSQRILNEIQLEISQAAS